MYGVQQFEHTVGPHLTEPDHIGELFIYVKHHRHILYSQPELAVNGDAVTSFVCSCLSSSLIGMPMPHCCKTSGTKPNRVL